jgi:hypothetical protein
MPSEIETTAAFPNPVKVPDNSDPALASGFYADTSTGIWAALNQARYLLKLITRLDPSAAPELDDNSGAMRLRSFGSLAAMRAAAAVSGDIALLRSGPVVSGLFVHASGSSATVDDVNVVDATTAGGRWLAVWRAARGATDGLASLDTNARVPAAQMPIGSRPVAMAEFDFGIGILNTDPQRNISGVSRCNADGTANTSGNYWKFTFATPEPDANYFATASLDTPLDGDYAMTDVVQAVVTRKMTSGVVVALIILQSGGGWTFPDYAALPTPPLPSGYRPGSGDRQFTIKLMAQR